MTFNLVGLVDNLVGFACNLIGTSTYYGCGLQCITDNLQHKNDKNGRVGCSSGFIDGIIVILLSHLNELFYRQPEKYLFPMTKKKTVPHSSNTAVTVAERMYEFKLVMKDCTLYKRVKRRLSVPLEEVFDKRRHR